MPDPQTETPTTEATIDPVDTALDKALADAGINSDDNQTIAPETPDDAPVEKPSRQRGPDGKFVKADTTADDAGEADGSGDEPAYSDDEIRRAVSAAQRDAAPKKLLKAIEEGDEETIAHYLKRAKVQQDTDEKFESHRTAAAELAAIKNKKSDANASATQPTDKKADVSQVTAPLAQQLQELIGEDVSAPLSEMSAGLVSHIESLLAERDNTVASLHKQVEDMAVERARDALISDYPDLKDKEVWSKVRKHLDSLPESEDRPDLQTRLEHAARIELAPEMIRRARDAQVKRDKDRDNGTPTAPTRAAQAKPKLTAGDLQDQLLDAMEKGDSNREREIKAQLRQIQRT